MKLPDLAIRRPVFATVVFLVITLLGAISFFRLPVDLMPDVTFPTITVRTNYPGVGPQEIEELISLPLERSLASTPGVKEISSTSSEGSNQVRVAFEWGTDLDAAASEVRARIDQTRSQLPDDIETPTVFKFDASALPVMFLGVSGQMDPRELRQFVEDQIQYRLERIPGVAEADVWGGLRREIHVLLNRANMNALRISPAQVSNALRRGNLNQPAGQVIEGDFELLVRTEGQFANLDQIAATMVTRRDGRPVYLRDIATIADSYQEVRNLVRVNGVPGLRMSIRKQSGANTVEVANRVLREIERINRDFPRIRVTDLQNNAVFIQNAVKNVRNAALYGSLLAVLILLVFLRNFRSTLIIGISIPISVIATFGLMYFYGFTLNIVTFGGLALGVGMLVDNAIVVLENIFRHREQREERQEAARRGTAEVALAITASTTTTVVVFLPVVFMSGMSGVMFQQLAWVVSFSLFSSLLVSLTLIPLMSSRLVRVREPNPESWSYAIIHRAGMLLEALDNSYARGIAWSLRHRALILSSTALLVGATLLLVPFIGFELQPETDEGVVRTSLELPVGSRLEVTDAVTRRVEEIIQRDVPEAASLLTEVGSAGGWQGANTNTASLRVTLVPKAERRRSSQQIAEDLRRQFSRLPGIVTRVRAGGGMMMMGRMQGGGDRLSLDVRAYDLAGSYDLAVQLKRMMESTEGISDAVIGRSQGRPESLIFVDRDKAGAMGFSVGDIAETIRTSVGGTTAGHFREHGKEYDIVVRYGQEDRRALQDVLSVPLQTPGGMVVPLASVVKLNRTEGPVAVERKDQQRIVRVSANLSGSRDLGSIVGELQQKIQSLNLPPDTAVIFGGEWEEQQEAFLTLLLSLVLAVVLVYMVLAAQFESFKHPLLIMFSLPLAAVGVVLALFLTDTTFNIQAFIGMIMLAGIVVNNAIVLVDYVLQLQRHHDFSLVDALITGGRRRLRPILMTTLTTILGLAPMALGVGEGAELQAPMARVLIGGLATSTLITLFLIPTLYLTLERLPFGRRREEFRAAEAAIGSAATGKP
ncbi:MAG: efflux RND transporter permease subunit [Acidobacteria bacterium]|nr:efflux RND transporter permease subunit [Acidobacteriota bacterium]